jgi:hypothetical protein
MFGNPQPTKDIYFKAQRVVTNVATRWSQSITPQGCNDISDQV